jgi:hypothetical protein
MRPCALTRKAIDKGNPVGNKVEERIRGCLARAHRIQLKMITARARDRIHYGREKEHFY